MRPVTATSSVAKAAGPAGGGATAQSPRPKPAAPALIDWRAEVVEQGPAITRALLALNAQADELEDYAQEVAEKLLRLGVQPQQANPKTVIWDVCCKVLGNHRRRERLRARVDPEVSDSILATVADTEARLDRADDRRECCYRIATLSELPRRVVYMRHVIELSVAETAASLDITKATVRVADCRGMAKLKANHRRGRPDRRPR